MIDSDCFGECLLHQSSLVDVIEARDRFLRPGGFMFPDLASLYITAIDTDQEGFLSFWDSLYGVNMKTMAAKEQQDVQRQLVDLSKVMTNQCLLKEIDLNTVKREDLQCFVPFQLSITKKGYIRRVALHYSIRFTRGLKRIKFSSGVDAQDSGLMQTVLMLKDYLICNVGDELLGVIQLKPSDQTLEMKLHVELKVRSITGSSLELHISSRARFLKPSKTWSLC